MRGSGASRAGAAGRSPWRHLSRRARQRSASRRARRSLDAHDSSGQALPGRRERPRSRSSSQLIGLLRAAAKRLPGQVALVGIARRPAWMQPGCYERPQAYAEYLAAELNGRGSDPPDHADRLRRLRRESPRRAALAVRSARAPATSLGSVATAVVAGVAHAPPAGRLPVARRAARAPSISSPRPSRVAPASDPDRLAGSSSLPDRSSCGDLLQRPSRRTSYEFGTTRNGRERRVGRRSRRPGPSATRP